MKSVEDFAPELQNLLDDGLPEGATVGSDDVRTRLSSQLPGIRELLAGSLHVDPDAEAELSEKERAGRQLEWVARVRSALLTPLEEAATRERNAAIQRAMTAGIPASALVDATGLTLARIYQIRDGRR